MTENTDSGSAAHILKQFREKSVTLLPSTQEVDEDDQ